MDNLISLVGHTLLFVLAWGGAISLLMVLGWTVGILTKKEPEED